MILDEIAKLLCWFFSARLLKQHPVHHLADHMADGNVDFLDSGNALGVYEERQVHNPGKFSPIFAR